MKNLKNQLLQRYMSIVFLFSLSMFSTSVMAQNPIVDYPLNGSVEDIGPNGNGGENFGAIPFYNRFGEFESAFKFTGSDTIVLPGTVFPYINEGSIVAWVKATHLDDFNYFPIVDQTTFSPSEPMLKLSIQNGNLVFQLDEMTPQVSGPVINTRAAITAPPQLSVGNWHQVGAVWNPDSIKIFIDGQFHHAIENADDATLYGDDSYSVYIGSDYIGNHANGLIDDFQVYNVSLGSDDILGMYQQGGWGSTSFNSCLVSDYPLNGDAMDIAGTADGIVESLDPITDRFGGNNAALEFNGAGRVIIPQGINGFGEGAISIWVNSYDSFNSDFPVLYKEHMGAEDIQLNIVQGDVLFQVQSFQVMSQFQISDGDWHHIVCNWNANEIQMYIDGQFAGSNVSTGETAISASDLVLGEKAGVFAQGRMDDFKIFNCPLSFDDVKNLYHENGWALSCSENVRASYKFNNGNVIDNSGSGFDGYNDGAASTMDRFGNNDAALYFSWGDTVHIPGPALSDMNSGSITSWFRIDSPVGLDHFTIIDKSPGDPNNPAIRLKVESGNLKFLMENASGTLVVADNTNINISTWYHVAVTWYSEMVNLYINGVLVQSMPNDDFAFVPFNDVTTVKIGMDAFGQYAEGAIDDLKIYNCNLDAFEIGTEYHEGLWDLQDFEVECLDFNDNMVPDGWQIAYGDSAFVANGKFITVYTNGDATAEMVRMGQVPENTDSLIIEWDSKVMNAQPFHFTGVGIGFADTNIFFAHMQSMSKDFGMVAVGDDDNGNPVFIAADSSIISTGIYRNKLVLTNANMYFTAQKIIDQNIQPFEINVNPFALDPNYSLQSVFLLNLVQEASPTVGYNWIDNVCINLIERTEAQDCHMALYDFNANLADHSGNAFHFSVENEPITYQPNRFGETFKSVALNVNNQELHTGNAPGISGDFALSTWVYPDPLAGTDTSMIFSCYPSGASNGNSMMLGIFESTGQIFFGHYNSDGSLFVDLSAFTIPTEVWSHIVLQRDSVNMQYTLYFNSDSVRTFDYPVQPDLGSLPSAYSISDSQANFNYEGRVDDTYLYKCLLSQEEVDSLYHIADWPQVMCDDMTITVTPSNSACDEDNGSAVVTVVGGSGVYTIVWSNGDIGNTADSLEAGMHSVQVNDNIYGCMLNQFFYINNTDAPTITVNSENLDCYNDYSGTISTNISGGIPPYTIEWSNGAITPNINGLEAGNYLITVVDNADCMVTESVDLTEPEQMEATFNTVNSSCGNADGELTVTVTGGTGSYTYDWSNGDTGANITGLVASNYTVTVEDDNNCQAVFTTGFSDSGSPIAVVDSTISAACGELGSLFISVTGGSGSYTYDWSNGETTEDLENFEPGEYWLTVTDGTCMTMLHADIPFDYPQTQEICVVTVDPTTATNLVVWEKEVSTSITHYNIYREGFVANDYQLVGSVLYDDMSEYSDPVASPFNRSWKYKVSAVDGCGNESDLSNDHKTIHLTINVGLGGSINLLWDDYAGFNYTSFYVNRHTTAGGWEVLDQMPTYLHAYSDNPTDLYGLWYSVTVDAPGQCVPTSSSKASGGPYYQSVSNVEDEGAIDTEVNELASQFDVHLFPNPNTGNFILGFNDSYSGTIEIVDISGKVVYTDSFYDIKKWNYDQTIESGIYMLKVIVDDNTTRTMKMIVE